MASLLCRHEIRYVKGRTPKPKIVETENRTFQVWVDKWPKLGRVDVSTTSKKENSFAKGPTETLKKGEIFSFCWKHEIDKDEPQTEN